MRGFTLIELLVVLVIIAAVTAMAVPRLPGRGAELRAEAHRLAAGLRTTRGEALVGNVERVFLIAADDPRFAGLTVTVTAAGEESPAPRVAAIRFFPDGSSTGGLVTLAAAGRRIGVAVDWLTGRVAVHEAQDG